VRWKEPSCGPRIIKQVTPGKEGQEGNEARRARKARRQGGSGRQGGKEGQEGKEVRREETGQKGNKEARRARKARRQVHGSYVFAVPCVPVLVRFEAARSAVSHMYVRLFFHSAEKKYSRVMAY
jgi:hypothetical protein